MTRRPHPPRSARRFCIRRGHAAAVPLLRRCTSRGRGPWATGRQSVRVIGVVLVFGVIAMLGACEYRSERRSTHLRHRLETLFELHTAETVHRDIVYIDERREVLLWRLLDTRVLFSVDYRVRAGLNLAEGVQVRRVPWRRAELQVTLPPAKVLSVEIDESSIQQHLLRRRGRRLGWLEIAAELERVKDRVADDAERYGLLQRAEANAAELARSVLTGAGFEQAEIRVRSTARPALRSVRPAITGRIPEVGRL